MIRLSSPRRRAPWPGTSSLRGVVLGLLVLCAAAGALLAAPAPAQASAAAGSGGSGLSLTDAIILGVVEGVTEYLPVSSTGHLLVTQRALGLTDTPAQKSAADAYAIVIQFGAILAVLVLYWRRFWSMLRGLAGRDPQGRKLAFALIAAVIPALILGILGEKYIKDYLFAVWPIIAAWIAGGIVILAVVAYDRRTGRRPDQGVRLEELTPRQALIVGLLQCVAMWPGVSRSLATILGGRLVGLSTQAAVEFSFLLGLVTLTAATGYETVKDGQMIVDTLGVLAPIVGVVVAFISAALAVKWMVGYLNKHSLAIFGWYRIALGIVVAALVLTNVL
jgi:undecaprenyl-diphosphatase